MLWLVLLILLASASAVAQEREPRIVFQRTTETASRLYTMDAAGSGVRLLTRRGEGPSWSPDGSRIAFARLTRDGGSDLYVIPAAGGKARRVTRTAAQEYLPTWSPDGRRLAFERWGGPDIEIGVVRVRGGGYRLLTRNRAHDVRPDWSPDGRRIAFASGRETVSGYSADLYVMAADGSGRRRLAATPAAHDDHPSWSPDGSRIAFDSTRGGRTNVYSVTAGGGDEQRLTGEGGGQPSWGAELIVFVSRRDGGSADLWRMLPDGSEQRRLTGTPADDLEPALR